MSLSIVCLTVVLQMARVSILMGAMVDAMTNQTLRNCCFDLLLLPYQKNVHHACPADSRASPGHYLGTKTAELSTQCFW